MSENILILLIVALLPLSACLLVLQTNPYRALVIRGVLGAIAALTYTLFGAADIALTEALMGTMLSVTLYAIAVRSSMLLKIGILESGILENKEEMDEATYAAVQSAISRHHLRLEILSYPSNQAMKKALTRREIHALYIPAPQPRLHTRVKHLHQILQAELPPKTVRYIDISHLSTQSDLLLETS